MKKSISLCFFLTLLFMTTPLFANVYDNLERNIKNGNITAVKRNIVAIIKNGGDIDKNCFGDYGAPALIVAVEHGHIKIAQLLLESGADIHSKHGPNDATALMVAASADNADMVLFLISQGANVNDMGYRGETALINASFAGNTKVIKSLITRGADVNAQLPPHVAVEGYKTTALLVATDEGHEEAVKLLLANNADMHRTWHGQSIFELAKHSRNTTLHNFLLAHRNSKLDDKTHILSQLSAHGAENEVVIEKRVTGAFSKPHAHEELIILRFPNTSGAKDSITKVVAVFDIKTATLLAKHEIIAEHSELIVFPAKDNTNIILATSYTTENHKKNYSVEAFQMHQSKFMPSDVFAKIAHKLNNKKEYLYKYTDNTLEIFLVEDKNNIRKIQHFLTCTWNAKDNSFHDIALTQSHTYRRSLDYQHVYKTWLMENNWSTFQEMLQAKEDEALSTIKKLVPHFAIADYQSYELIEKDDTTSTIARIMPVVDENTITEHGDSVLTHFYAIQTYVLSEKNGLEILSVGEPLAIQQSRAIFFPESDKKSMGLFLSNFSELGMNSISVQEIMEAKDMDTLLSFGIYHNYINNFKKRIIPCKKSCSHGEAKIHAAYVKESLKKYFDYDLTELFSSARFHFDGTYYHFNTKKEIPVLYVRVENALQIPGGNIRMEGVLYNAAKKDEIHGRMEAIAKPYTWKGKKTWAIVTLARKD